MICASYLGIVYLIYLLQFGESVDFCMVAYVINLFRHQGLFILLILFIYSFCRCSIISLLLLSHRILAILFGIGLVIRWMLCYRLFVINYIVWSTWVYLKIIFFPGILLLQSELYLCMHFSNQLLYIRGESCCLATEQLMLFIQSINKQGFSIRTARNFHTVTMLLCYLCSWFGFFPNGRIWENFLGLTSLIIRTI